ncbi:phage baseplate assembly protein V [Salmonella sp. NW805]|uniref:phage baseplate assembly protein V n=1 Tax=unclassified Salmonella TaxID=2614656 RepID=UPI0012C67E74|nr:phage baseplate assembly protein V [Salmonella enterica]EDT0982734.1 phage baseplate assembly protein V [Salmonella enterica subsp. enterica serovar Mikawasima]EFP3022288.1 phage baseplate assembly protein V [Salmonella enterica]EFS4425252.1 phage baseplate assembly protein V [Salmonella enterica]EGS9054419.1 phage baseplate assembly protein V [Salmonella enterica]
MNGVIFATGTVSAIDPVNVRARVRLPDHDNLRTWWLDVMQNNTYKNKDYCMPDVGEQVKVLMTPDGVEGVILGAVYSGKDTPVISDPDRRRTDFADGTFVEYDRKNNAMAIGGAIKTLTITTHSDITLQTDTQVTVIAQNSATVKTQKATIDSPETEITGNTTIKKNLLVEGSITGKGGMSISGGSGGAAATITGSLTATGDISAGGTSLKRHEHPKGHNGAPTGPPSS